MSIAATFRGAAKLRRSGMFRSEPGGVGRFIGPKASCWSVLCRSYGAWLTSATAAGYRHGAPTELAPGTLTSDLLEFKVGIPPAYTPNAVAAGNQ